DMPLQRRVECFERERGIEPRQHTGAGTAVRIDAAVVEVANDRARCGLERGAAAHGPTQRDPGAEHRPQREVAEVDRAEIRCGGHRAPEGGPLAGSSLIPYAGSLFMAETCRSTRVVRRRASALGSAGCSASIVHSVTRDDG